MLYELKDDVFYKEYDVFRDSVIDYFIIKSDEKYVGEISHKKAVIFAMDIFNERFKKECDEEFEYDISKIEANKIEAKDFFNFNIEYNKNMLINPRPYISLFLDPPFGTPYRRYYTSYKKSVYDEKREIIEEKTYTIDDFIYLNNILFPNSFNNLDVFEWSTDWSEYFEMGLEWWGARCVSVYDKDLDRFVVIMASTSD